MIELNSDDLALPQTLDPKRKALAEQKALHVKLRHISHRVWDCKISVSSVFYGIFGAAIDVGGKAA